MFDLLPVWIPVAIALLCVVITICRGVTQSRPPRVCLWFAECGKNDAALVGGKGCNLGECTRAGFPVPPGFCVTSFAYKTVVESLSLSALTTEEARKAVATAPLPPMVLNSIVEAYSELSIQLGSDALVAVRSSGTAEDSAAASFAGQLESYLGLSGQDQVVQAIRECWGSLYSERVVRYRKEMSCGDAAVTVCVVVQVGQRTSVQPYR